MLKNKNKLINTHMIVQILCFIILVVIDQITKYLAVVNLKGQPDFVIIDKILVLQYLENRGAAFGIFQNMQWMFYIITVIVIGLIFYLWFRFNSKLKKYCKFCEVCPDDYNKKTFNNAIFLHYIFMLLAAGALGNLIDRVVNSYVVDFIYVIAIDFPVFNFADICVTVSAALLVVYFIFIYKEDPNYSIWTSKKK